MRSSENPLENFVRKAIFVVYEGVHGFLSIPSIIPDQIYCRFPKGSDFFWRHRPLVGSILWVILVSIIVFALRNIVAPKRTLTCFGTIFISVSFVLGLLILRNRNKKKRWKFRR
jgi:hypothetical protein